MSEEWGYEFFKIDGISGVGPSYSSHFYERPDVRAAFAEYCDNPLDLCVQSLRRGIGEGKTILACMGHYTGPEVQSADAARIGGDIVAPNNPPRAHNYIKQAASTLAQLFAHRIVWFNDPDTLLVGTYAPIETARLAAAVVALPGQVMFAGDKLAELPPERMWLLQRCLPVCEIHPLDLFPIYELRRVWDLKIRRDFGSWDVVSLFNFDQREQRRIGFRMAEIGLKSETSYLIYDFWSRRFMGAFRDEFTLELPPMSNALLAVHEDAGRPQFLSSDRHLTQGGVEIESMNWDVRSRRLSGRARLVGGDPATLIFHVPDGFEFVGGESSQAAFSCGGTSVDRTLKAVLSSETPAAADWALSFRKA